MENYSYMNIKADLLQRTKEFLLAVLSDKREVPADWKTTAEKEGFSTVKDYIRKELSLIDYELETRRRFFDGK